MSTKEKISISCPEMGSSPKKVFTEKEMHLSGQEEKGI